MPVDAENQVDHGPVDDRRWREHPHRGQPASLHVVLDHLSGVVDALCPEREDGTFSGEVIRHRHDDVHVARRARLGASRHRQSAHERPTASRAP